MPFLRTAMLLALAAGALHCPTAFASSHTSAITCDVQDPGSPAPNRSWGIANYGSQVLTVTCPMPTSSYVVPSRNLSVSGWTATGTVMFCTMWVLRKQDRRLLGVHSLLFSGGARQQYVHLGSGEDGDDTVSELSCTLPPGGKGVLYSLESNQ